MIIRNIVIPLKFNKMFSIVNAKKLMLHNRKTIQNRISGSDMHGQLPRAIGPMCRRLCRRFRKKEIPDGNDRV